MLFLKSRVASGRKEVRVVLDIIFAFLISVAAGITSYYICKWLDRDD
jgi:hypothetical protein